MTLDAVEDAATVLRVQRARGPATCSIFSLRGGDRNNRWSVNGMAAPDRGIIWLEPQRSTPTSAGIGVGTTTRELQDAYPEAVGDVNSFVSVEASATATYHFWIHDGRVTRLRLVGDESACLGH